MLRGLFITGTDTGVGKTVVSAALMHRYRPHGPLRYWKPIQTGIEQDDDTADVARLADCVADETFTEGVRLRGPVSPHLAAQQSGCTIAVRPLIDAHRRAALQASWIIEGAGGVLVPLNSRETMADLMLQLGLPVVVVARTTLGTINHTLLTVEALRRRSLEPAGVVMVGPTDIGARKTIETHGAVMVLGEMPLFDPLTSVAVKAWSHDLDRAGQLLKHLI
ncbi:hypothetical protein BH23ACI1_BH23ACI1_00450 [soil metagenome]